jgi:hypothetical protein
MLRRVRRFCDFVSVSLIPPTFLAKKSTPQAAGEQTRKRNKNFKLIVSIILGN